MFKLLSLIYLLLKKEITIPSSAARHGVNGWIIIWYLGVVRCIYHLMLYSIEGADNIYHDIDENNDFQ